MKKRKNTRQHILQVAEKLFAQKGFAATAVTEIASMVNISSPAIYKHFPNKLAIYEEVCQGLFTPLAEATKDLDASADFSETRQQIQKIMALLTESPNVARLIQHATLAEDETLTLLREKWYRQFFSYISASAADPQREFLSIPTAMAFHSMILGYVTLAPLHKSLFGIDPLEETQLEAQLQLQEKMVDGLNALIQSQKNA